MPAPAPGDVRVVALQGWGVGQVVGVGARPGLHDAVPGLLAADGDGLEKRGAIARLVREGLVLGVPVEGPGPAGAALGSRRRA